MQNKMEILLFLITVLNLQLVHIKSERILAVYPTPSFSHQVVFRRITDALIERGHHVTVITTDPKYSKGQAPQNLTEIDVHDLSYDMWRDALSQAYETENGEFDVAEKLLRVMSIIFKSQITSQEVQELINNKKSDEYDLILLEAFFKPGLIFSHIFKAPVILISSFGSVPDNFEAVGAPNHLLLYPIALQKKIYNLSKLEKLQALYDYWWYENLYYKLEIEDGEMLKAIFGPNTPSINQLLNNIDMLFLNVHPIWTDNQPVPPSVVYIGGIHTETPKELPKDLQTYLDASKNGVIYFSLGTNVFPELFPPHKIQMFVKVFSQLPYNILWKWNKDTLPGKSENIKISKWLPQSDLLRHPNIKVFITQGGLQSTDEAILAGVPLIGLPILVDQFYNVQKYAHHGIGMQLDMDNLSEDEFRNAINEVISNTSFKENIKRLRYLIEDRPMTPQERAMWWIEHVLRHRSGKHLRAAGANITWTQYLELDLVLLIVLFVFELLAVVSILIYFSWKLLLKYLGGNKKSKIM